MAFSKGNELPLATTLGAIAFFGATDALLDFGFDAFAVDVRSRDDRDEDGSLSVDFDVEHVIV